tara:strand:+ start:72 stop:1091 length:1020 start_codon:yes stop_codon:yes gene_type:complete
MSDKKPEDTVGDEPAKDVAAGTVALELAGSEQESSELESSQLESSDSPSSDTDAPDSAESTQILHATAEKITESLEQLLPSVLEIAEATNSAADVNLKSTAALNKGLTQVRAQVKTLSAASEQSAVLANRVMIGALSALIISVVLYSVVAFQLASRVTLVDSMLVAVSKRVVQMNSALETFEQLRFSINQLSTTQAQFSERQLLLIEAVSRAEVSARSLVTEVPDLAAQKVGLKTDQIITQVSSLGKDLEGQGAIVSKLSKSVGALGKQMKSLEGQVGNVKQLNADVEALIALERENYLEVLQRQVSLEEARQAEGKPVEKEPEPLPTIVVYPFISVTK